MNGHTLYVHLILLPYRQPRRTTAAAVAARCKESSKHPSRSRLALLLYPLLADRLLTARRLPLPLLALLDESAHLATTALLVPRRAPLGRWEALGAAAGSVLVDLDHLPHYFRTSQPRPPGRPAPHSALSVATLLGLAWALALSERRRPRRLALGAAFGLTCHLARDAATGGVPLGWPAGTGNVTISRPGYIVLLLRGALGVRPARAHAAAGAARRRTETSSAATAAPAS
ncbi:MAG TPA: metal-dependent hydrolase [Nitrolancea sp.]|nr:metal-dependent hydrolase [Nitrolancea sp.]